MKGEIDTVYNNSMESIFAEIEETKTRLADEQNKKREEERAQKRKELQSRALVRKLMGGSDEDMKPLTAEEEDLLAGRDMEHLIVIDGVVCRLDDSGEIIGPSEMADKYRGQKMTESPIATKEEPNQPDKTNKQHKEVQHKEILVTVGEPAKPIEKPKEPAIVIPPISKEVTEERPIQKIRETSTQNTPEKIIARVEDAQEIKKILTDKMEILSPVQVSEKTVKIYFAVAHNKKQHKAAYAAVIKRPDNTDILIGESVEVDIPTDIIYIGITKALQEYDKLDVPEVVIYSDKNTQQRLRRNSTYIVDGFTPATGEYLALVKAIAQKKYIAVTPRESRLEIQKSVQQLANTLCTGYETANIK